jgi:hypothetical protein
VGKPGVVGPDADPSTALLSTPGLQKPTFVCFSRYEVQSGSGAVLTKQRARGGAL